MIVGGGQAGAQAVQTLRKNKFDGKITLIGEEPYPPYQRPPLSKKYLAGELERDRLFLRPLAFYEKNQVDLQLGTRATLLDPEAAQVTLEDGRVLRYDGLLLATGSRVRRLEVPGADLNGIHYVRTVADVGRSTRSGSSERSRKTTSMVRPSLRGMSRQAASTMCMRGLVRLRVVRRGGGGRKIPVTS